jgi:hypothetical protein
MPLFSPQFIFVILIEFLSPLQLFRLLPYCRHADTPPRPFQLPAHSRFSPLLSAFAAMPLCRALTAIDRLSRLFHCADALSRRRCYFRRLIRHFRFFAFFAFRFSTLSSFLRFQFFDDC